jgi:hypothetical protein
MMSNKNIFYTKVVALREVYIYSFEFSHLEWLRCEKII